tara:strand:- start:220 stop:408 length:189 start_codon:yes stop_codon:yes gene_type:complete
MTMSKEHQTWVTGCCYEKPIKEDWDQIDGDYGVPEIIGNGLCGNCNEWSRLEFDQEWRVTNE